LHLLAEQERVNDLVLRHWPRLAGFFRAHRVPEYDIDDLIQEVWLRVLRGSWDGNPALLMHVARQRLIDWRRKKRPTVLGEAVEELAKELQEESQSPHPRLIKCLERLRSKRPEWYAAVVAVYYEGRDMKSVSVQLDVNPTTLRTRLLRAREALRGCVGEDEE